MIKRLFIACPLRHVPVNDELANVRKRFRMSLRPDFYSSLDLSWEAQPHITLRFLGAVDFADPRTEIEGLVYDLEAICGDFDMIPLSLDRLSTFPGVLWYGVWGGTPEALGELNGLQEIVDRVVCRRGFGEAQFPFLPHVTVARFSRDETERLSKALGALDRPTHPRFEVGSVEVFESVRDDHGEVRYERLFKPALFRDVQLVLDTTSRILEGGDPSDYTAELDNAVNVLRKIQRAPNCWCEAGVGNPMVSGHTEGCKEVQKLLRSLSDISNGND